MSFSNLLQNAPYYSPAAFTPTWRKHDAGPASSSGAMQDRAKRIKAPKPLVDPYASLSADAFDSFVDGVSNRIVDALTYEPNRDRRIRRGYADDEEYWLEMGGKPGEFLGVQAEETTAVDEGTQTEDIVGELDSAIPVQDEEMLDEQEMDQVEVEDDMEEQDAEPEILTLEDDIGTYEDQYVPAVDQLQPTVTQEETAPAFLYQGTFDTQDAQQQPGLYPDLSVFGDFAGFAAQPADASFSNIQIPSGSLYPSLADLEVNTAPPVTVNENYQLDLLRQYTYDGSENLAAPAEEPFVNQNGRSIEELLALAEKDAEEATEAIHHIEEEDEIEERLDNELLAALNRAGDELEEEDARMASEEAEDEMIEEDVSDAESLPSLPLPAPSQKQKSTSQEVSDVISIGSSSGDEDQDDQIADEEEEEDAINLDEEEEEDTDAEVTPPPMQRQPLFGQLDAPEPSQARYMSQKIRRHMEEDDIRVSGFHEDDLGEGGSQSSDASDEHAREWQQFKRKGNKGQRIQNEQDAADRYFDDDEEADTNQQDEQAESDNEEEDSDGESSDSVIVESDESISVEYHNLQKQNVESAEHEFEDELDDDAVADEEMQAERANGDLDERVPIPAFMKKDEETGEYELRGSSSDEEEDHEEDDQAQENNQGVHTPAQDMLIFEVLDDDDVEEQEGQVQPIVEEPGTTSYIQAIIDSIDANAGTRNIKEQPQPAETADLTEEVDEEIDIRSVHSAEGIPASQLIGNSANLSVSELVEQSMVQTRTIFPEAATFTNLPPLPTSLADFADQLVNDALQAAKDDLAAEEEEVIMSDETAEVVETKPLSNQPSQVIDELQEVAELTNVAVPATEVVNSAPQLHTPARKPRLSTEPRLFTSMAVSPEQFSLTPKPSSNQSTPSKPAEMQAFSPPTPPADEPMFGTPAWINTSERSLTEAQAPPAVDTHSVPEATSLAEHEADAPAELVSEAEVPAVSTQDDHTTSFPSSRFNEDHHHEPPPPVLQEQESEKIGEELVMEEEPLTGVDITTDEMETHSASGDVEEREASIEIMDTEVVVSEQPVFELPASFAASSEVRNESTEDIEENVTPPPAISNEVSGVHHTPEATHFTEDHHFERPPPELEGDEQNVSHAAAEEPLMAGIDLTTDEMENHSANGDAETQLTESKFKEDHHFEPPPPELEGTDPVPHQKPAAFDEPMEGVDFTTDEMEVHSVHDEEEKVAHRQQDNEADRTDPEQLQLSDSQSAMTAEEQDPISSSNVELAAEDKSSPQALPVYAEPFEPTSGPAPTEQPRNQVSTDVFNASPTKASDTPSRAYNAIAPGLWDPSTPIRFGGRSLEAAVREAYYDPERSANLRKSLGDEDNETQDESKEPEDVKEEVKEEIKALDASTTEIIDEEDFVPLDASEAVSSDTDVDGIEESLLPGRRGAKPSQDDVPDRISSPGIKQADGDFTQAVQDGDYVVDSVSSALAQDSDLPALEPEVVLSASESTLGQEDEEEGELERKSRSSSASEIFEYKELINKRATTATVERAHDRNLAVAEQEDEGMLSTSSSDDDSDDGVYVATSLVHTKSPQASSSSNRQSGKPTRASSKIRATPAARRGRGRPVIASERKGKGKADIETEAESDNVTSMTIASFSTDSESDDAVHVTSVRAPNAAITMQVKPAGTDDEEQEEDDTSTPRAVTPDTDAFGRNIVTTVIVPGSPIESTTPIEELEVSALLAPRPSRPRFHRHGAASSSTLASTTTLPKARQPSPARSTRSSTSRNSAEPISGSTAAPVHPEAEHASHISHVQGGGAGSSPIQTRSHCTYHKLMIPNPYLGSLNTPGRRVSTRLARAVGEAEASHDHPASFIFLVPGCCTADRKEQMQEGGIVDLGVASVEEEGSAMTLQANDESESGLRVEGLPDSVLQSLIRVVGLEMFREGDCEILAPLLSQGATSPARKEQGNGTERKRRRESEIMSPPSNTKRLNTGRH